jgi:hypothetical protein
MKSTSQGTRKEKERTAGQRKKHDLGKKLVKVISRGERKRKGLQERERSMILERSW